MWLQIILFKSKRDKRKEEVQRTDWEIKTKIVDFECQTLEKHSFYWNESRNGIGMERKKQTEKCAFIRMRKWTLRKLQLTG